MNYYKNKVVWITGASSGLGEALTYALANKGAQLIISSRNEKELLRVKGNCKNNNILILPHDIAKTEEAKHITEKGIKHFGRIDILINNAAVSQRSPVSKTTLETERKIMDINFFGTVALTKSVLPFMLEKNSGQIAVISSLAGKTGFYYRSAYCASKHALHGFFESLQMELKNSAVKITIIIPPGMKTKIAENALIETGQTFSKPDRDFKSAPPPDIYVPRILNEIKKKPKEVNFGFLNNLALFVKRMSPKLYFYLLSKYKH